jgi:L-threonylcarbamoyladenylate synthase
MSFTLDQAIHAIRHGQLVGMPTETVYGLAADATDASAVAAIFAAKGRPHFDPLIVHVADLAGAEAVAQVDDRARQLMRQFWPGPLTLVLPRREIIPDLVTSGLDTVGVRCPDHELARQLIQEGGRPLAAPSANRFGHISPTTAAHVQAQLAEAIAGVLDGGSCRVGVESTVLALGWQPLVLRPGGISCEQLSEVLGQPVAVAKKKEVASHLPAEAPGLLASHYAPRMPVILRDGAWPDDATCGLLAFTGADLPPAAVAEILSPTADLAEAATRLFAALRRLEARCLPRLMVELVPEQGLGVAINDRLRRAAGRG